MKVVQKNETKEISRRGHLIILYSPRSEKLFTPSKVGLNNLEPEAKTHTPSMDRPSYPITISIFFIDSQQTSPLAPDVKDLEETYTNPTLSRPSKLLNCACDFKLAGCGPRSSSFSQPVKMIHTN